MPSTRAGQVIQIRAAGTEVQVTAQVINSSGETWYAVKLYQGYVGYIRADLLRVELQQEKTAPALDETDATLINIVREKTNVTPKVIYIVVDPQEVQEPADTQIYVITPEQAEDLGIG